MLNLRLYNLKKCLNTLNNSCKLIKSYVVNWIICLFQLVVIYFKSVKKSHLEKWNEITTNKISLCLRSKIGGDRKKSSKTYLPLIGFLISKFLCNLIIVFFSSTTFFLILFFIRILIDIPVNIFIFLKFIILVYLKKNIEKEPFFISNRSRFVYSSSKNRISLLWWRLGLIWFDIYFFTAEKSFKKSTVKTKYS